MVGISVDIGEEDILGKEIVTWPRTDAGKVCIVFGGWEKWQFD